MGLYAIVGNDTNTASTTQLGVQQPASALKRIKISYLELGSDASADSSFKTLYKRSTTAGTSTAFTPTLLDPADGAASAVGCVNFSAEPTYTANSEVLALAGHQRATVQWYAAPGGEIVIPVTNNAGIGAFSAVAATPFNQVGVIHFSE